MNQINKNDLTKITEYNEWANERIAQMLKQVNDESFKLELISSFKSLKETTTHIWDAQVIWLKRLCMEEVSVWPSKNALPEKADVISGIVTSSHDFKDKVQNLNPDLVVSYKNLKGEEYSSSVSDIAIHCINHSTFHRGQIITLLRQTGFKNLLSTDYIVFSRK